VCYGWWIVGGCVVALFVAVAVGMYAPSVLLVPLQAHFGWSGAAIAAGSATATLTTIMTGEIVGDWIHTAPEAHGL